MTVKIYSDAEIKEVIAGVVCDLNINLGLGSPDIAKVVRMDERDVSHILLTDSRMNARQIDPRVYGTGGMDSRGDFRGGECRATQTELERKE